MVPDASSAGNLSLGEEIGRALLGIILPAARFIWTSVNLVFILLFIPSVALLENRARTLYDHLSQALEELNPPIADITPASFLVKIFSTFVLYGVLETAIKFTQSGTSPDKVLLPMNAALWIYIALPIPIYLSFLVIRNFLLRMVFVIPGPRWYRSAALRSSLLASWALTKLDEQLLRGFNEVREIMSDLNIQLLTILGGLSVIRASVTRISDKITTVSDRIFQKYLHDRQSLINDLQELREILVESLDGELNIEGLLENNYIKKLVTHFERESGKSSVESRGIIGIIFSLLTYSSLGGFLSMGILLIIVFAMIQAVINTIKDPLNLALEILGYATKVPQEGSLNLANAVLLLVLGLLAWYFIELTIPEGIRVDRSDLIAMTLLSLSILTTLGGQVYIIHVSVMIIASFIPSIAYLREREHLSSLLITMLTALSLAPILSGKIPQNGALAFGYEAIPLIILLFLLYMAVSSLLPAPIPERNLNQ